MGGTCSKHGTNEKYILVRNPEEKRPLGKPKHKWANNIKMSLNEIGEESVK
jgi:hypothetical protein